MINEHLFKDIYNKCLSIINTSKDQNILNKQQKLASAYSLLRETEAHELQEIYSVVYELQIYQYIKDLGIKISSANDIKAGPDFITDLGYIECVCATKGLPGTPERKWLDARLRQRMNRNIAALPRLSSAIKDKAKKYEIYLHKQIIDKKKPCIIGLSTSIFSNEFYSNLNLKLILKILYGIGYGTMTFNSETNSFIEESGVKLHDYESIALKPPRNVELPLSIFYDEDYKHISAIILNNNSIGKEIKKEYFYMLLNPLANVPVDESLLNNISYLKLYKVDEYSVNYKWF